METKFAICDRVAYFNTAESRVDEDIIQSVRIIATGVLADENGADVCDGFAILYQMKSGMVLTEAEVFASVRECVEHFWKFFGDLQERLPE